MKLKRWQAGALGAVGALLVFSVLALGVVWLATKYGGGVIAAAIVGSVVLVIGARVGVDWWDWWEEHG